MWYDILLEKQIVPDFLIRQRIRNLLKARLRDESHPDDASLHQHIRSLVNELKESPIAINTQEANEQHYELPTSFFELVLGPQLKYSSGFWEHGARNLKASEQDMLLLTCERAQLMDGQDILELGCGWGSLSLFMAENYRNSRVTAVSNSNAQREFIEARAAARGLTNLRIITADMNDFDTEASFDRVVSVEMFEHMRNYRLLMHRIAQWLKPEGRLFVHIFTHHKYAYKFEVKDDTDWMSKYFFTGGIMPSNDLLFHFDDDLQREHQWLVNGQNYQRTSEEWLKRMDENKEKIIPIMKETYGEDAMLWFTYWRIFFMACAELWGYNNGEEWMVSHYLFKKQSLS